MLWAGYCVSWPVADAIKATASKKFRNRIDDGCFYSSKSSQPKIRKLLELRSGFSRAAAPNDLPVHEINTGIRVSPLRIFQITGIPIDTLIAIKEAGTSTLRNGGVILLSTPSIGHPRLTYGPYPAVRHGHVESRRTKRL